MPHTSRTFTYPSFEELQATGMFTTEANCSQYLLDKKLLPTKRRCLLCPDKDQMNLKTCSTTRYRDGCCWQCPAGHAKSLRAQSVLENSKLSYKDFINILSSFSEQMTPSRAAEQVNVAETTVRKIY